MMRTLLFTAVTSFLLAGGALAQAASAVNHTPPTCVRAGELPLMQVHVEGKGELRAYFRRMNTSDWCSVEGVNDGPLARIVLPRFDAGDEFEYFFVLLDGRRVAARSPRIYRIRVTGDCESPWARHVMRLSLSCGDDAAGVPSAMGAGYAISDSVVEEPPVFGSPDRPDTPPETQPNP